MAKAATARQAVMAQARPGQFRKPRAAVFPLPERSRFLHLAKGVLPPPVPVEWVAAAM
jgi:hypothetical protein